MNTKRLVLTILLVVTLVAPLQAKTVPSNACPMNRSIYRDGNGNGYQLVFGSPPPKGIHHGTAVIQHPNYGQLYRFTVDQFSGYGSVSLSGEYVPNSKRTVTLWITFFNENLESATPLVFWQEKHAPKYAVIAELGGYDHYRSRDEMRKDPRPPMRDPMWIFDRCQSERRQEQ